VETKSFCGKKRDDGAGVGAQSQNRYLRRLQRLRPGKRLLDDPAKSVPRSVRVQHTSTRQAVSQGVVFPGASPIRNEKMVKIKVRDFAIGREDKRRVSPLTRQ
jgi:hypothetical protein